jgi:magnesium chelatase family protein
MRVARGGATVEMPARFQLIAAMSPCPCGQPDACTCTPPALARYHRRITPRLLDRFDLRIALAPPPRFDPPTGTDDTATVARRVAAARTRIRARGTLTNTALDAEALAAMAPLNPQATRVLDQQLRAGTLSGRGLHRAHAVALTIADLAGRDGPLDADTVTTALHLHGNPRHLLTHPTGPGPSTGA